VTGGNPFLLGELLEEVAARRVKPVAGSAPEVDALVPRGVANAVLLRLSRLAPEAGVLARALSVLGDGAQVGDAGLLVRLTGAETETAMAALVSAGVVEAGGTVRFAHPILGTAIYGDLSPAERERLHHGAATILRDRGAPEELVAAQVMHTEPAADPEAVALLRRTAREALALGAAAGAAALLERALEEPPTEDERPALQVELGRAYARAGAPEGIAPLSEIVDHGERPADIATAAIELSSMLFFTGQAGEAGTILRRAHDRLPAGDPARAGLEVALLGVCCTSAAARVESDALIADLCSRGVTADGPLGAGRLATLAMDEAVRPGSAEVAAELAERALAAGLPRGPHHAWSLLCLMVLTVADRFDVAAQHADELLAEARRRGAGLTVAAVSSHCAYIAMRRGDLTSARADADAAIELTSDMVGSEFVSVIAVPAAVLAGLDRDETHDSLRRMIDRADVGCDVELSASSHLRYASGVLRAAAGDHEAAVAELRECATGHPVFGGENPAVVPWRSAAALSLAELGRDAEARSLAKDELRRAREFGAPRAIGVAQRALALVGPREERSQRLELALDVLAESPARLERARVLLDIGATRRAAGQRSAAKEPLTEALALAARCGARGLEQRARAELAAIGVRPRTSDRSGVDSLTPSERRVVELAADGGTNREIAQTLFVTEKTVETHLGRAFRKLDVSSRRQLPDVLARAAG
jgi:DNA-binding CsgD family transcriptional regulator